MSGPKIIKIDVPAESSTGGKASVTLTRGSEMKMVPISWLWKGWLAAGKMHVFGGVAGTGKTTVCLRMAATMTVGGLWPDGSQSPTGNVVIWSGEDDPHDTLLPRLAVAGADLSRVYFIGDVEDRGKNRTFDPARDFEVLGDSLAMAGDVRLLIVDPIVSAVTGDSHKNAEVRRSLQPLADLASSLGFALVGITHFSKGTGGARPVERLTGSLAFGALARVVFVAADYQEQAGGMGDTRVFCRAKSNIGPDDGGFEYSLAEKPVHGHPEIQASAAYWGNALEGDARALLSVADSTDGGGSALDEAKAFLADLLADGPMPTKGVQAAAKAAGHASATVRRAKGELNVEVRKEGGSFGKGTSQWFWTLPA